MLAWQISRTGLIWLFLAVMAVVAPLVIHLPLWVTGVPLFGLLWRIGIYRGALGPPGKTVKVLLVLSFLTGLVLTFNRLYGLEPMASMLIGAFGLKLLEIRHRRDALVVIYLGYFVAAIFALFDQSIMAGAYVLIAFGIVTAALAGLHQSDVVRQTFRPGGKAVMIILQSLPLMVILFLVMPRLGPLWSVPSAQTAVTGMSDHLSIGDITQLGKSSKTAFRVSFEGDIPPRENLYWRGLTFSRFDGKTWRPVSWGFKDGMVQWYGEKSIWWDRDLELEGTPSEYEVILERQNGPWLYNLMGSQTETQGTGVTRMQTLVSLFPISGRFQYKARFWPSVTFQSEELTKTREQMELALPENSNPQTLAMARQWASETPDVEKLAARLLNFYRSEFSYTLQPPPLGVHSIDDFMFVSKQGFCEHFASSFVFFMRAAGHPARLVVGYQGGEVHPEEGYLTVRQYDAHAWAEVWIDHRGWVRYDPTAAVAPDRIALGLISMLTAPVVFADTAVGIDRFRDITWVNQLRLYLDSLDYAWGKWVLGYQNLQVDFMRGLLGELDTKRLVVFVFVGSLIGLLPVMIYSLWPRGGRKGNIADKYYREFCFKLSRGGCARRIGESPGTYARRCSDRFPTKRQGIEAITQCYEISRYSPHPVDPTDLKQLVRQFKI